MKALFVIFHGFDPNNGISKKISYQVDALKACNMEVHLCYMDEHSTKKRLVDNCVIANYGRGILSKIRKRIEFSSITRFAKVNGIEFVYIRSNHNANPFTIKMVKQMKRAGMKVVMEIPTFPYDSEYKAQGISRQIIQDKFFRNRLAKHLDAIVTFSDYKVIFGQRTIRISNGIDFDNVKIKTTMNDTSKELNLIGVAEIHEWHGFDRLVKGLAQYYSQPQDYIVRFHVVGYFFSAEGEAEFKRIISDNNMENYVILHGKKHGKELDNIFNQCDFGVGSLGRHRVGIQRIKTLKNREYAARGIPFVYSETDSDFDQKPYVLKAPADDTPIDINKIVEFYKELDATPHKIRDSIHDLAWNYQMKRVIDEVFTKGKKNGVIKLAYCIPSLDRASGMERVLSLKANYLADILGYDVNIILTDNKDSKPYFPLSEKIDVIQLDVNIDNLWRLPLWKRILPYIKKEKEYKRKLKECLNWLQPDITISLMRREINFINNINDGSKKLGEIHFGRYKYREFNLKFLPSFINKFVSAIWMNQLIKEIKKLDRFIVLTHEDATYWKEVNNISVIPNPITIKSDTKTSGTNKRVISVGRYTYQKGFDLLIKAWKDIAEKHPDWSLDIYGPGDTSSYTLLTRRYNIEDKVFCHGATTNIIDKYLESSIYVLSSRFEGFGLVLAEAMSVGLPCVSFACPCGPRDIIKDGEDGILCEEGNTKQLSEGICRLIEDNQLRQDMGRNAKQNIQRFTIERIMQKWDILFKEIIEER